MAESSLSQPKSPVSAAPAQYSERSMMRAALALFFGYLCISLPLPVIPIFVRHTLGYNDFAVGLSVGIQFLATVLTRGYAGRRADSHGGKRTMLQGTLMIGGGGAIYILAAVLPMPNPAKLGVLILGRLAVGLGESQLVTGTLSWIVAALGPKRAGKAMSWTGMAIYGSLAAGAPIGMALFQSGGFLLLAIAAMLLPLVAALIALSVPAAAGVAGERVPLSVVFRLIWRTGLSLGLQGVGFATIGSFASLYFVSRGWAHAGLAMTCFGGAYAGLRVVFGHLPDRIGGFKVALISFVVECAGQALLWLAPNELTALAGALVTGFGCSLIFPALGVETLKVVPPQSRGTALGGFVAFQDVAYGITGPITGILAGSLGYPSVFMVGTIGCVLGFGMTLITRAHARRSVR